MMNFNYEESKTFAKNILEETDEYSFTNSGINKIYSVWEDQKTEPIWDDEYSVMDILSKHPNYVPEKGYVVFSNDFERPVDTDVITNVLYQIANEKFSIATEVKLGSYTYYELKNICEELKNILYHARNLRGYSNPYFPIDAKAIEDCNREYNDFYHKKERYEMETYLKNGKSYTRESFEKADKFGRLINRLSDYIYNHSEEIKEAGECLVTEQILDIFSDFEEWFPLKGVRVGHKFNRTIGKLLKLVGLDKNEFYNSWSARLGDACSPTTFTRHTIISANPIDYWTMSYGNDWCSCQNIDKNHHRESSDLGMYGDGCRASGTESLMLDNHTVVMYTVDANYNGKDFELQDKINRCLFHIGDKKFVMGRVYPQGTDGEKEVYRQWRQCFQNFLSTALGITNYWKTERDGKKDFIESHGTHYEDYFCSYTNVAGWSWWKPNQDSEPTTTKIKIGHKPICPNCGAEHTHEEHLNCYYCYEEGTKKVCSHCGSVHDEEDMYYIDGEWYCYDCTFWCDYHERREVGEGHNVGDCYYVCDYARDNYFVQCEECGEWISTDSENLIETLTGHSYCCEDCAIANGYEQDEDGDWVRRNVEE